MRIHPNSSKHRRLILTNERNFAKQCRPAVRMRHVRASLPPDVLPPGILMLRRSPILTVRGSRGEIPVGVRSLAVCALSAAAIILCSWFPGGALSTRRVELRLLSGTGQPVAPQEEQESESTTSPVLQASVRPQRRKADARRSPSRLLQSVPSTAMKFRPAVLTLLGRRGGHRWSNGLLAPMRN